MQTAVCDSDCTFPMCGDAHLNTLAGEVCDAGGESFGCDVDCTLPMCGDGVANASHAEDCDDGIATAACDTDCTAPSCGDGVQNIAALETCDDGDNVDGDGCSSDCFIEGDFGGQCRIVDGRQWCFDNDNCGQACDDVCTSLGLTIEADDMLWYAAQDTLVECQAISDAFGIAAAAQLDGLPYGCLEDAGNDDTVGGGLTGPLTCSTDATCPGSHRTQMDDLDGVCNLAGARRSVCPCEGEFCGNGLMEGAEECDDGNQVNGDGCTASCLTTPPSCVNVGGIFWCYNPDACGQACNDVCDALGLSLDISDADWVAAQDTNAECQAIADAFGMLGGVSVASYAYACAEEEGSDDIPDMGLSGLLYCSTDAMCPTLHRTTMDNQGLDCPTGGSFRSICPCN
jgi:cysteine-rich repeat protein